MNGEDSVNPRDGEMRVFMNVGVGGGNDVVA